MKWTQKYIDDLPDDAFAFIESGGKVDDTGKTSPRSLRHFPHHNASVKSGDDLGTVDIPNLKRCLVGLPSSTLSLKAKVAALRHMELHWEKASESTAQKDVTVQNAIEMAWTQIADKKVGLPSRPRDNGIGSIYIVDTTTKLEHLARVPAPDPGQPVDDIPGDYLSAAQKEFGPTVVDQLLGDGYEPLIEKGLKSENPLIIGGTPLKRRTLVSLFPEGQSEGHVVMGKKASNQYQVSPLRKWLSGFATGMEESGEIVGTLPADWAGLQVGKSVAVKPGMIQWSGISADEWVRVTKAADFSWVAGPQTPTIKQFLINGQASTGILTIKRGEKDGVTFGVTGVRKRDLLKAAGIQTVSAAVSDGAEPVDPPSGPVMEILKAAKKERLVYCVALVPEVFDAQDEIYSADVIKNAAHSYLARYNIESTTGIDHEDIGHSLDIPVVESCILLSAQKLFGRDLPAGTWVVVMKVLNDVVWARILKGLATGISIGGKCTKVPA